MYMQIFFFPSLYHSHGHIWAKIPRYAPALTPKKRPKTDHVHMGPIKMRGLSKIASTWPSVETKLSEKLKVSPTILADQLREGGARDAIASKI